MNGFLVSQFKGLAIGIALTAVWAALDWLSSGLIPPTHSYAETFAAAWAAAATAFWVDYP